MFAFGREQQGRGKSLHLRKRERQIGKMEGKKDANSTARESAREIERDIRLHSVFRRHIALINEIDTRMHLI